MRDAPGADRVDGHVDRSRLVVRRQRRRYGVEHGSRAAAAPSPTVTLARVVVHRLHRLAIYPTASSYNPRRRATGRQHAPRPRPLPHRYRSRVPDWNTLAKPPSSISRSHRQASTGTSVKDQAKTREASGDSDRSSVTRNTRNTTTLGAPGRIRTCDLKIRSLLLYPAELRAREACTSVYPEPGELAPGARQGWERRRATQLPEPHWKGCTGTVQGDVKRGSGAGDGLRTRDPQLGRLML